MKKILSVLVIVFLFCAIWIIGGPFLNERYNGANISNENIEILNSENIETLTKNMEILIESNQFKYFSYQSGERAICVYEGAYDSELLGSKFAVYKETLMKDIVFVNMVIIEADTYNIYTWNEDCLTYIGDIGKEEFELNEFAEYDDVPDLLFENMKVDELLDCVIKVLAKNGFSDLKLIYDGDCEFINRKYYVVSSFSDFEDHIIREETFYVDMENGNIYKVSENNDYLRRELWYLGSLNSGYESEWRYREWENLIVEDYFSLVKRNETVSNSLLTYIAQDFGFKNAQLITEASVQINNSMKELYLIRHKDSNNEFAMIFAGVLVDGSKNTSEILFQTKDAYDFLSFEEYYDMKVCDIDGNGEEDIILLLGAHRLAGPDAFLPDIYCMLGLQKNGKFHFVSNYDEKWLEEIVNKLYNEQSSNRNIGNIFGEALEENHEKLSVRDYICNKDDMILKKLDNRSLYSERELLWETFELNDNENIQSIKIYKETGERGCDADKQIVVYLFDYATEEAESQAVPNIFADLSKKYSDYGGLKDICLEKIRYEDINKDGTKDIIMTLKCSITEEIEEIYEVTYYQEKKEINNLKIFDKVIANEV